MLLFLWCGFDILDSDFVFRTRNYLYCDLIASLDSVAYAKVIREYLTKLVQLGEYGAPLHILPMTTFIELMRRFI